MDIGTAEARRAMSTSVQIESTSSNGFDVPEVNRRIIHDVFPLNVHQQKREKQRRPKKLLGWSRSSDLFF